MYGKAMFISLFLFLPSLLFSAGGRGIEAEKEADKPVLRIGKQYALLIGISAYRQWIPLRNPVHDLREISGILTSRYRYAKKNVIELYDRKATKANIIRTFETLQKQLTPDDSLLILYSGHGHLDAKTNSGFWIPVDSGKDVYKQENWLPNSQIRGLVSNIEANHVLLLVDSCFSGDIIDGTRSITGMNDYFVNAYSHVSRQVITSGASETVPDNSEFCRQLKRILKQNREPYLDSIILYNEIRLGMRKTLPVIGSLSGTGHQDGSSFLIFLKEEEIPAEIEISARVDGSIVLDGEEQGTIRAGKSSTLEVKAGNHTVAVRYDEENREEKTLSIGGGEKSSLVFTWEPKRFGALS
ncbi:MAG: caspase family protein, partial [Spirochaetales bacterium]|nr:caspase family protein [Spirochaetales bacterium]